MAVFQWPILYRGLRHRLLPIQFGLFPSLLFSSLTYLPCPAKTSHLLRLWFLSWQCRLCSSVPSPTLSFREVSSPTDLESFRCSLWICPGPNLPSMSQTGLSISPHPQICSFSMTVSRIISLDPRPELDASLVSHPKAPWLVSSAS